MPSNGMNVTGEISSESGSETAEEAAATLLFRAQSDLTFALEFQDISQVSLRTQTALHSIPNEPLPDVDEM